MLEFCSKFMKKSFYENALLNLSVDIWKFIEQLLASSVSPGRKYELRIEKTEL